MSSKVPMWQFPLLTGPWRTPAITHPVDSASNKGERWQPPKRWVQVQPNLPDEHHTGRTEPAACELTVPPPRTKFCSVVHNGRLVVFGGGQQKTFHGDVYEYTFSTKKWRLVHDDAAQQPQGPCRRRSHKAVLWRGHMVVFGGRVQYGRKNDVYMLDLSTYIWKHRQASGPEPPQRAAHSAVRWRDNMLVFGGDTDPESGENGPKYLADLWSFDLVDGIWTQLLPKGEPPSHRLGHACAVAADNMYLFGGFNGGALNDLYALSIESCVWRRIHYNMHVRPASFHAMVEEPGEPWVTHSEDDEATSPIPPPDCSHKARSFLLWGGLFTDTNHFVTTLYRFKCDEEEFEAVPTGGERPKQRLGHALALSGERLYLFGGCDQQYYNDIHMLDLRAPTLKEFVAHCVVTGKIPYRSPEVRQHDPYAY
eukprot:Sspe_Gene.40278::Locus_19435_Transcript_1_1_Confidence_1.000_Length_1502::g.40278::m.40278